MYHFKKDIEELMILPNKTSPNYEREAGHYDMAKTILLILDRHNKEINALLSHLSPDEGISEDRKLGYRLGVEDTIGVFTGRTKRGSSEMMNQERIISTLAEAVDALAAALRERR